MWLNTWETLGGVHKVVFNIYDQLWYIYDTFQITFQTCEKHEISDNYTSTFYTTTGTTIGSYKVWNSKTETETSHSIFFLFMSIMTLNNDVKHTHTHHMH